MRFHKRPGKRRGARYLTAADPPALVYALISGILAVGAGGWVNQSTSGWTGTLAAAAPWVTTGVVTLAAIVCAPLILGHLAPRLRGVLLRGHETRRAREEEIRQLEALWAAPPYDPAAEQPPPPPWSDPGSSPESGLPEGDR